MAKAQHPSGYIVYRGPSQLNGAPIVVVAITKRSTNTKTGDIVQTYIMADNGLSPVESAKTLADAAVCGDCPHRRGLGGACYVNLGQGPRSVMDSVMRGIYPVSLKLAAVACSGRMVRLGTYGDPAAVPAWVWATLLTDAAGNTGYSHQWRKPVAAQVMQWCMASADTEADRAEAKTKGFRTFRIRTSDAPVLAGEFICPASSEAGKRLTCADCGACSGGINTRKADPVIIVHGALANRFAASVAA